MSEAKIMAQAMADADGVDGPAYETLARAAIAALAAAGFAIVPKDEAAKVRAATIEECAGVAEKRGDEYKYPTQRDYDLREGCFDAAAAIRALGENTAQT